MADNIAWPYGDKCSDFQVFGIEREQVSTWLRIVVWLSNVCHGNTVWAIGSLDVGDRTYFRQLEDGFSIPPNWEPWV